jgi:peptidoglycan/LPS O-acetylase OafA/YrhL
MKIKRFNWQVWAGFLLSFVAAASYPFVFVSFPVTRDFPWANFLLFAFAAALLLVGVRRAFAPDRSRRSKIASSVLAILSVIICCLFILGFFILSRLPPSHGAPQVGQKAPDFSLTDTNGKPVSLSDLLSTPINGKAPKGVLLVFYRGYW